MMRASIESVVRYSALILGLLLVRGAPAQEHILINEIAIEEHTVTGQSPFVELYCSSPLICRQDPIDHWIIVLQGDIETNPGQIAAFQPYIRRDSAFGAFSLQLMDLPEDVSGSPTVLLAMPDHDVSLSPGGFLVRWKHPTTTGYDFSVATTGPGRTPRVSAYNVLFADTTLSTSIVSGVDLPFRVHNLTENTQIDTFVPDTNGNGEWDLGEQIILVEYVNQVQTATWQLELWNTRPEPGNVLTIWVVPDLDLDTDDDGVLDHPITILDGISLPDGDPGDLMYSETILPPDFDAAATAVLAASRRLDGHDSNAALDWRRADLNGDVLAFEVPQTPGLPNNSTGVGFDNWSRRPSDCEHGGNYPNPFREMTRISHCGPDDVASATITVFDLLGRVKLEVESVPAGQKGFEATIQAKNLPSGVYFYVFQAGEHVERRPMVVVK